MCNNTILVADSDGTVAACISEALTTEGYTVYSYPCDRLTLALIERVRPDLVIMEQPYAGPAITPLLDQLRRHPTLRGIGVVVSTTDSLTARELAAPLQQDGYGTLLKPFGIDQLLDSVAGALAGHRGGQRPCRPESRYA